MYGLVPYLVLIMVLIISWKADSDRTRETLRIAAKSFAQTCPDNAASIAARVWRAFSSHHPTRGPYQRYCEDCGKNAYTTHMCTDTRKTMPGGNICYGYNGANWKGAGGASLATT